MDPQIKQRWVDALRSGQYKQGKGFLHRGNKFCCLGVLCDTVDASRWTYVKSHDAWAYGEEYPSVATTEINFDILQEIMLDLQLHNYLIKLNDWGHSFEEIATYIETHL
jgi:hypothetical protein